MEFISNISNILTALTSIVAVFIGGIALYTWRKEFIGKKKIELAAEIMQAVCDIQDVMIYARLNKYSINEIKNVEKWMKTEKLRDPQNADIYPDRFHFLIANRRLEERQDKIDKLTELSNTAYIYFGEDIFRLFQELHKYTVDVRIAANKLYYNDDPKNNNALLEIIYTVGTSDKLTKRIADIVEECKLNFEPLYKDNQKKWKSLKRK